MAAQSFSATKVHAFASNPLTSASASAPDGASFVSVDSALASIRSLLKSNVNKEAVEKRDDAGSSRILPVKRGKPLVVSVSADCKDEEAAPAWRLAWQSPASCGKVLEALGEEILVFLGHSLSGVSHWALDVSDVPSDHLDLEEKEDSDEQQETRSDFVELRTLMVAADWSDVRAMSDLSIAGHARALLEWNALSQFCSRCGTKMIPIEGGRRRQCQNSDCKRRYYPRVDPVVIMLVIDKENDRALLSRQSRFVPRMWSCLAGFIEPGESLEEAVRRETLEEVGIEVGEVTYHSSQPWPVGPSSMPCQLMVGFFAAAKSLDICVDKKELEDAQWHSREDVTKALSFAEYKKAQRTSAFRVHQICGGIEKGQGLASDFNIETGELAPMFFPGPFAIAHHLISSWARQGADVMTG